MGQVCTENITEIECDSWCGCPEKGTAPIYGHNGEEWCWQPVSRFMVCGEMGNPAGEG